VAQAGKYLLCKCELSANTSFTKKKKKKKKEKKKIRKRIELTTLPETTQRTKPDKT
jgi:hypothetical protein